MDPPLLACLIEGLQICATPLGKLLPKEVGKQEKKTSIVIHPIILILLHFAIYKVLQKFCTVCNL